MRTIRSRECLFGMALLVVTAALPLRAAEKPIFTLTDPRGDDHGDGSLIYPQRDDIAPGELDILSFSAYPGNGGTVFEATFARPVRKPERRTIDEIGTSLDSLARLGFYTFNIDVYIDTDRVPGSGSVTMLPGRRAEIDPASAWEKAVCLTPRPYEAQDALRHIMVRDAKRRARLVQPHVDSEDVKEIEARVADEVASRVFFPTLVWVTGARVRFFVPLSFLGGLAKPEWAYVVAVSGADIQQRVNLSNLVGPEKAAPEALMILPVQPGRGPDFFGGGREDDTLEPPLVDIIVPPGKSQEEILKDYDLRTDRPVRLPGVVPAAVTASPPK